MNTRKRILWITQTALFIALLVAVQSVLKPLGQFAVGSIVNLLLITSVMLSGLWSGVTVAVLSPLFAFLLGGQAALPQILPLIMLGNLILVLIWHFLAGKATEKLVLRYGIATVVSAVVKFLFLWLSIVKIAVPLLGLPEKQAAILSVAFSYPQLITASIGGVVATILIPILKRVLPKKDQQ